MPPEATRNTRDILNTSLEMRSELSQAQNGRGIRASRVGLTGGL